MEEENKKQGYGKRPLWQWLALYAVIGIIVYGLVYYFVLAKKGGSYSMNSSLNSSYSATQTPSQAPSSAMEAQKITVVGSEFAFTPSSITLKKGLATQITFKNMGKFPHNLTIPDLNVKTKTIQPGEQDTIQFTPDKTGQFSFICTVPGHVDKGMKGTLTVQ